MLAGALAAAVVRPLVYSGLILTVVLANAIVGFLQEGKAEHGLAAIRGLIADHQSGARDHSAVLWVLLMFESFLAHDAGLARRAEAA